MVTHKVFEFHELEFIAVTAYQVKKVSLVHSKKNINSESDDHQTEN